MGAGLSQHQRLVISLREWKKVHKTLETTYPVPTFEVVPFSKDRSFVVRPRARTGGIPVNVQLSWISASNAECALLTYVNGKFQWGDLQHRVDEAMKGTPA